MPADSVEVLCGNCRAQLDEDPQAPTEQRKPCPSCGSLSRHVNLAVSDTVKLYSKVNVKGKRPGLKRPFIEQTVGDDLHRKTGRWMKFHRIIDRVRDWYSERVTDPDSGEIIHSSEEPLSEHRGHGSDKRDKPSQ